MQDVSSLVSLSLELKLAYENKQVFYLILFSSYTCFCFPYHVVGRNSINVTDTTELALHASYMTVRINALRVTYWRRFRSVLRARKIQCLLT